MSGSLREIKSLANTIDNEIQKLEKTWETPHLYMYGYGEAMGETNPNAEFFEELKQIQDQLKSDQKLHMNHIKRTESYLSSVQDFYDDVKQQCDDIEIMLSDYGYQPSPDNLERLSTADSEIDSSILTISKMENSLSNSYEKSETDSISTPSINVNRPQSIATPVITSLASATKLR